MKALNMSLMSMGLRPEAPVGGSHLKHHPSYSVQFQQWSELRKFQLGNECIEWYQMHAK